MKYLQRATAAVGASLLAVGLAPVATSASTPTPATLSLSPSAVISTDSGRPDSWTVAWGEVPVGTTARDADGVERRATHRAYAEFDISALAQSGVEVGQASLDLTRVGAPDCRTTDLTVSALASPSAPITWNATPAAVSTIGRLPKATCDGQAARLDAEAAITSALARGEGSLWVEVRVTGAKELAPSYGAYVTAPAGEVHYTYPGPDPAPVINVTNEAELLEGHPVKLRFDAGGATDIRCYQWSLQQDFMSPHDGGDPCELNNGILASSPTASVTTEIPTSGSTFLNLFVRTINSNGEPSDVANRSIVVPGSWPTFDPAISEAPGGVPITMTLTSHPLLGQASEFVVTVNDGPEQHLPATDNRATLVVTPVANEGLTIRARSVGTDGTASDEGLLNIWGY